MKEPVGLIGLGNMGGPYARRIAAAGHALHVCDTRTEVLDHWRDAGATVHASPQDLGDAVETVLLSLPTPDVVKRVILGRAGIIMAKSVRRVVDLSTTGPDVVRALHAELGAAGVSFVDAPVSGGVAGAEAGKLAIMLACSDEDRAKVEDILSLLGQIYHVGTEPGLGQVAKVLNNLLSAGSLILSAEVAAMGVKAGLDPVAMIDVFNAGSGRNSATLDKYPRAILPGTFSTGFTNRLMYKDVQLCLALARQMELELPTAHVVAQEWLASMEEVGPEEDFSRIVQRRERIAGVQVRTPSHD
jgi:3-hydroxyisobutyrate dehydrogenase-like beta-hydroxyacid dehydrogenase